jgi:hypothetical protein
MEAVEIVIAHPDAPTEPMIILATDYDPKVHVLWEVRAAELAAQAAVEAALADARARQARLEAAAALSAEERQAKAEALLPLPPPADAGAAAPGAEAAPPAKAGAEEPAD